ncbi:MAG TPA: glycosyltransferase [Nannocystaceae bacterium]|nr:glycosyltransferase [Nannocystaceae bacterium]
MALVWLVSCWAAGYVGAVAKVCFTATKRHEHRATIIARVLLVRPCAGAPTWLAATLPTWPRTSVRELRWVAAIQDRTDPAWQVAADARSQLSRAKPDVHVVATAAVGPNHKVDQLACAVETLGDDRDVLVVADSDVDLDALQLDAMMSPLAHPEIAACWCPTIEVAPRTLADGVSATILIGSLHAFTLLASLDSALFVGKVFAVRTAALAAAGGLGALRHHLGEDFELARRLRTLGLATVQSPTVARSLAHGRDLRAVLARHTRWFSVLRAQRPRVLIGVPLLIAAAPLLLLAAATIAAHAPHTALAVATVVIAARLGVVWLGHRRGGQRVRVAALLLALPADLVLLAAFVRSLTGRSVRWADRTLRLGADGRLEPIPAEREPHGRDAIQGAGRKSGDAADRLRPEHRGDE